MIDKIKNSLHYEFARNTIVFPHPLILAKNIFTVFTKI